MRGLRLLTMCGCGLLLLPSSYPLRAAVLSNIGSWNGSDSVFPFGPPNTQTFGQILATPVTDTVLESWTFYMRQTFTLHFQGELYAWDDVTHHAVGPNLWEGPDITTSNPGIFEAVTFNTGGIQLVGGSRYVLFASSSKLDQTPEGGVWGLVFGGSDDFAFVNNGTDTSQWTTATWTDDWGGDLVYSAEYSSSAVPEPGTSFSTLIGLVSVGFGLLIRRLRGSLNRGVAGVDAT